VRAVQRLAYRVAYRLLQVWWWVARPHSQGVKCVLRDGEHVVLVRHTYGDRQAWELPGGGLHRGEDPRVGASRETREELGLDVTDWQALGTAVHRHGGHTVTMHLFTAVVDAGAVRIDGVEIAEARVVPARAPPGRLSPMSGRALEAVLSRTGPGRQGHSPPGAPA